jgi:hypothetical protein
MTNETIGAVRKWTLDLGKVDANGRGRKANRVTLEVELRRKVNDVAPYLDIDLKPCTEYTELSICGNVWNAAGSDCSGGQNREEIAKLFPNNAKVKLLVEIWERWHLGGMRAGCVHQTAEKWSDRPIDHSKPTNAYVDQGDGHQGWNMLVWVPKSEKHPNGLLSAPCPTCGYKYGTAWLVEALPAEVEAEVVSLCGALSAKMAAETSGQDDPKDFAEAHRITATAERADSNPNMEDKHGDMRHWKVTLRHGSKRMTVPFSQGSAHTKPPTAMDVLGNLASDASGADESFEAWASNYGYDSDSRKAKKTYDAIRKATEKLKNFLGLALFTTLIEDSNG